MTAPESQPLTEEDREHWAALAIPALAQWGVRSRHGEWTDYETQEHCARALHDALTALIAARTADLRDRLKAAEGVAERARIDRADYGQRALHAEADKARAVAEARATLLDEVEQRVLGAAPRINFELRYDGTEDPLAAAYVQGFHEAWQAVSALRDEVSGS